MRSVPIGSGAAPLQSCAVRIEHVTTREAEQRYAEVGRICISYTGARSPQALEMHSQPSQRLSDKACALGGNVVVPLGMCSLQSGEYTADGFEYHVYRDVNTTATATR
jgi:hypothetical protein